MDIPAMDKNLPLKTLMDVLFMTNELNSWSVFSERRSGTTVLKLRFAAPYTTNFNSNIIPVAYKKKSRKQSCRDYERKAQHEMPQKNLEHLRSKPSSQDMDKPFEPIWNPRAEDELRAFSGHPMATEISTAKGSTDESNELVAISESPTWDEFIPGPSDHTVASQSTLKEPEDIPDHNPEPSCVPNMTPGDPTEDVLHGTDPETVQPVVCDVDKNAAESWDSLRLKYSNIDSDVRASHRFDDFNKCSQCKRPCNLEAEISHGFRTVKCDHHNATICIDCYPDSEHLPKCKMRPVFYQRP